MFLQTVNNIKSSSASFINQIIQKLEEKKKNVKDHKHSSRSHHGFLLLWFALQLCVHRPVPHYFWILELMKHFRTKPMTSAASSAVKMICRTGRLQVQVQGLPESYCFASIFFSQFFLELARFPCNSQNIVGKLNTLQGEH